MRVSYRPRATVGALASQYYHYGRWRHAVARIALGHDQPALPGPADRGPAMLAGALAGLVGLARDRGRRAGLWPDLLLLGFAVPLAYLLGISP